jgi:hypothetical protein
MNPLSAEQILTLWEETHALAASERAVRLCAAALPELDLAAVRSLPVGRRDAAVSALRRQTFGARAECYVRCPACGEPLEFPIDLDQLAAAPPDGGDAAEWREGPWRVRYRLPSSADLVAVAGAVDATTSRRALFARCLLEASRAGDAVATSALPPEVLAAIEREMERRDPQGQITLELRCVACPHAWTSPFDVAAFLWQELEQEARHLLREVDVLARAYGWSEGEVLRLGSHRRRIYLEMAVAT